MEQTRTPLFVSDLPTLQWLKVQLGVSSQAAVLQLLIADAASSPDRIMALRQARLLSLPPVEVP